MNRTRIATHLLAIAACPFSGPASMPHSLLAQVAVTSDCEPATSGRVATLREMTPPSQDRVLLGRIQLLAQTIEQALDAIEHNQLQAFARKWAHAVDLYQQLGDQISQSSEAAGRAEVALEQAEQELAAARGREQVTPEVQQQAVSEVNGLRAQVVARLRAMRAAHQQADEQQQQAMYPRLNALVQQLRQLDQLQNGLQSTTSQSTFLSATSQIDGQIAQAKQMLQSEREVLQVMSQAVRVAMQGAQSQIGQAIALANVQAQIPRTELQQLGRTRVQVQSALDQVLQARRQAEQLVDRLLNTTSAEEIDQPALMAEIDRLLQSQP
ncbi:MAG: hypothetical protein J5I93_02650 [Pirellulaceae bacterium]|nr:hypothetical protein [Pirellulaceae bacterium]